MKLRPIDIDTPLYNFCDKLRPWVLPLILVVLIAINVADKLTEPPPCDATCMAEAPVRW